MIHHCRLTSTAFLHQVGAKVHSSADSPDLADPADQANQVSLSAARSLPSTRAGGQDAVSFNKLPQIKNVTGDMCLTAFVFIQVPNWSANKHIQNMSTEHMGEHAKRCEHTVAGAGV